MNFDEIYKQNFKSIYKFFYYKSVNSSEIEDLVHEVFIRYFNKFSDKVIDLIESKKILFGISNNLYKEWVRKKIKENQVELIDNYEYEEYFEDFSDNSYEKKIEMQKKLVLEAMQSLGERVRLVLEYRFMQGLKRREIAEKLNMKEKDVHTYQKRGIKYLDKILNNSELSPVSHNNNKNER